METTAAMFFSDQMNQFKNRGLREPCVGAGTSEKPLFWMLVGTDGVPLHEHQKTTLHPFKALK